MRLALTLIQTNGKWSVLSDPNTPIDQQKAKFKEIVLQESPGIDRIELWESSSGRTKHKNFRAPVQVAAAAESDRPRKKKSELA